MQMESIREILGAEVLCGKNLLDMQVEGACGADLMSDVLASVGRNSLLLTGLCTTQVIRTAEMIETGAIIFVRGKRPDEDVMRMAQELNMVILTTPLTLYHACGILYQNGLRPNGEELASGR